MSYYRAVVGHVKVLLMISLDLWPLTYHLPTIAPLSVLCSLFFQHTKHMIHIHTYLYLPFKRVYIHACMFIHIYIYFI